MNENDIYSKLIDLYAGRELPADAESMMNAAAATNHSLGEQMMTLRATVDALQAVPSPEFTEESCQRILLKMYARGVELQKQSPDPYHLQYQLPIQS
jgi:anti-sigma factor RsiW